MPPSRKTVLHWFRRDLRISDNQALHAAASEGLPVVPVYLLSDWKGRHAWTGAPRQQFLCGCLTALANNLETLQGRLILRQGPAMEELPRLIRESGAVAIHFNRDPDPFGQAVEARLEAWCRSFGVRCHGHADVALHRPEEVLTQTGKPYRVVTPYSTHWLSLPKPLPVARAAALHTPQDLSSLPLPTLAVWGLAATGVQLPEPGERAARKRLDAALAGTLQSYAATRDLPAANGTSRLSQDLRHGLLSPRTVYARAMKAHGEATPAGRQSIAVFVKELAWREFGFAILHHFPNVLEEEFQPEWRGLPWRGPGPLWEAWKEARTGFPIVDAGMRELRATGFMHNRVRMITAMFLTKDLHIDWKLGESWFMQHLVDGEIASNNGGWQWSAGTGADAAPFFRIQNPWTQTAKYDPAGAYIKRWLPSLASVDPARFTQPPKDGRPLAADYPLPCVDHATERRRTLEIFRKHREATR